MYKLSSNSETMYGLKEGDEQSRDSVKRSPLASPFQLHCHLQWGIDPVMPINPCQGYGKQSLWWSRLASRWEKIVLPEQPRGNLGLGQKGWCVLVAECTSSVYTETEWDSIPLETVYQPRWNQVSKGSTTWNQSSWSSRMGTEC